MSLVVFSSNIIPDKWRFIYSINPIVGVIDGVFYNADGNYRNSWIERDFDGLNFTVK